MGSFTLVSNEANGNYCHQWPCKTLALVCDYFLHYQTNLEWLPSLHKRKSFLFKNLNEYEMQIRYSSRHYWQWDSSEFQLRERMVRSWKSEERMKAQRQESMWQQQSERERSAAAQRGVSAKKTTFFGGEAAQGSFVIQLQIHNRQVIWAPRLTAALCKYLESLHAAVIASALSWQEPEIFTSSPWRFLPRCE